VKHDKPFIAASAKKHGITDADMIHAFNNPLAVDHIEEGFTMFIGGDQAANTLEVGVVDSSEGPVIVHAMRARPQYRR